MINRIQQYLLVNYPVIWNIKLVPMLLLILAVNLFFYLIGYALTDNTIDHKTSFSGLYYIVYTSSILISILIFIFWLVQYNKSNGLKAHYPQSNTSLYAEWLCLFALCFTICFIPNSLSLAKNAKWENVMTQVEYETDQKVLNKVRMLLPTRDYLYQLSNEQPLLVGDADVDRTKFDTRLYTYDEQDEKPNPIEYVGPSLLYFDSNKYYWQTAEEDVNIVHEWLVTQQEDSIRNLLDKYLVLQAKYKKEANITTDQWMKVIYNPPLYPINEYISDVYTHGSSRDYKKYVEFDDIATYYKEVGSSYDDDDFNKWFILITLTCGMGLSLMVFSGRLTSGRSWIFALLSAGVLSFALGILVGIIALITGDGTLVMLITPMYWLSIFVAIGFAITLKVVNGRHKGRSNIYINLGIWMIGTIIPWCYYIFIIIYAALVEDTAKFEDQIYALIIINILFTTTIMYPTVILVRKWKALPEE